jgi:hypothetical protein
MNYKSDKQYPRQSSHPAAGSVIQPRNASPALPRFTWAIIYSLESAVTKDETIRTAVLRMILEEHISDQSAAPVYCPLR